MGAGCLLAPVLAPATYGINPAPDPSVAIFGTSGRLTEQPDGGLLNPGRCFYDIVDSLASVMR